MMPIELFYGIVEDNSDPDKKGKLKIRVLPEMKDASIDHLPWFDPFQGGSGAKTNTVDKAYFETGSPVWCFFSDTTYKRGWYISGVFLDETFDWDAIKNQLSNISEGDVSEISNLSFSRFKNGTVEFRDHETGVMGVYHNSGSYTIFDANGGIVSYSKSTIKMYTDDNVIELGDSPGIDVDAGSGTITLNGSGENLVKYKDLYDVLNMIIMSLDSRMYIDPLSGFTGTVNPTHLHAAFDPQHITKLGTMKALKVETS